MCSPWASLWLLLIPLLQLLQWQWPGFLGQGSVSGGSVSLLPVQQHQFRSSGAGLGLLE